MNRSSRARRSVRRAFLAPAALAALAAVAGPLAAPAAASVDDETAAFVHVNVVPMDEQRVLRDQTVLVSEGRILRIGPADEVVVPEGSSPIDGGGRLFLMPGLCDSHVHVGDPDELPLYVANGVTTVRNMSGEPFHLYWRREIAEGRLEGPTLLSASPTLDGVPPEGSNRVIVTTREAGARAVEAAAAAGFDCIKVYGGLSEEALGGIVEAAHRAGLKVVGHVPRAVGLQGSLAAGQDSIDHAEE